MLAVISISLEEIYEILDQAEIEILQLLLSQWTCPANVMWQWTIVSLWIIDSSEAVNDMKMFGKQL